MNQSELTVLLRKADELRSLFVLGQRVIPFLEELFLFVKDIEPMLNEINTSINENLKKMPGASKQLSKVTEATELATTEIMDIVDSLNAKADVISGNLEKLGDYKASQSNNPLKILEIINNAVSKDTQVNKILPEFTKLIENIKEDENSDQNQEYNETVENTKGLINDIRMDSSSIMMALQVQDITSQQLAAVNNMIEAVQSKLQNIMKKFENSDIENIVDQEVYDERTNFSKLHRNIAFDPEAVDSMDSTKKENRQKEVDDLIEKDVELYKDQEEEVSDDVSDIDEENLTNTQNSDDLNDNDDEESKDEVIESDKNGDDDLEQFSQDDIDALFGK